MSCFDITVKFNSASNRVLTACLENDLSPAALLAALTPTFGSVAERELVERTLFLVQTLQTDGTQTFYYTVPNTTICMPVFDLTVKERKPCCMFCGTVCPEVMEMRGPNAWHINCHTYLPVCPTCVSQGKYVPQHLVRNIQAILSELHNKLAEAARGYHEGLVCPRENLNYLIDAVCTANWEADFATCSQEWKPCLLEDVVKCNGKKNPKDTDIVGKCELCKKDVHPKEHFTKTGSLEGVKHHSCILDTH